ncbi:hypothetical protein [Undibacterium umbellatum]|uniref:SH3b domain-containing protein n=1 Tax=Undibacterium umbellatum TaxID=2762300 RepID=A0ABR6ZEQ9_9BURK|nr:hypothetical protein [Undibacterium umbellatum]MBC3910222.1 hypothetical protein [Undibacterium umbellatum]
MKKISSPLNLAALFTATFICYSPAAQADSSARWVHGSWVNVRAKPEVNAAVLTHLVANTPVQLDVAASSGKYCAISWGQGQQGFIACNLLGDKALRLEDFVDSYNRTSESSNYFPARTFWMAPSFRRLQEAGLYFQETTLSPQQKALETADNKSDGDKRPAIKRFPIPEFEAMKQLMMAGVIEPASAYDKPPALWDDILKLAKAEELPSKKVTEASSHLNGSLFYPGVLVMLRQLNLPAAAPSYFKSLPDLGRPSANPEELSRQYQIPYAIKPLGGPYWNEYEPAGIGVIGWWDLGKLDVFLQKPVMKHSLMLSGRFTSSNSNLKYSLGTDNCKEGFRFVGLDVQTEPVKSLAQRRLAPKARDEAVLHFYTLGELPALNGAAQVTTQAPYKLQYDTKAKWNIFEHFSQASMTSIDLDKDGVADFAIAEAWHRNAGLDSAVDQPAYRVIFVNAAGRWYIFDIDRYSICGC